jgi:hypothetical protein
MAKTNFIGAAFSAILWAGIAMAQGTNATLTGIVADPGGGALQNVTLTLENTRTGVGVSTVTNDSGVYRFPSTQPGVYRVRAERNGFETVEHGNLTLEIAGQVQLNLTLPVAGIRQTVEVTQNENPLTATTASVGRVIDGHRINDLPRSDRNTLGLVDTQAGIVRAESNNGTNYNPNGAQRAFWNVTLDGLPTKDAISNSGVSSIVYMSPDLVDEVRIVVAPADAELGRGSGQVQVSTRAGTREFHGSLFESHRNAALNASSFFNNLNGQPRDFLIRNQFGGRVGGPIVRDRTFFHFLYDAQREVTKESTTALVYTEAARRGDFRFFPGALNQNFNGTAPSVDVNGFPVRPPTATGDLATFSVLGRDPARPGMDPTGTVQKMLALMPLPNNFRSGDGLNTAGHVWSRRMTSDRDQFSTRIDHKFNTRHGFHFSWTHEEGSLVNGYAPQAFPQGPGGSNENSADIFSLRATSTLSERLVNEFFVGTQRGRNRSYAAWERDGEALLPVASGVRYRTVFAGGLTNVFPMAFPSGARAQMNLFGNTASWTYKRHVFRFGGEVRLGGGPDAYVDIGVTPAAVHGPGNVAPQGFGIAGIGANVTTAQNLLYNLSGSLAQVNQRFYATGGASPTYAAIAEGRHAAGDILQREFSLFFKDDWKVRRDLALNLGMRFEYYGVPWMVDSYTGDGTTNAVIGGSDGLYGISGTSFADLYRPGHLAGTLTRVEYVGPNTANSERKLYNGDWNNFAPAVGLSWNMPYFGARSTVLRMGYGIGYERIPLFVFGNTVGLTPGTVAPTTFTSSQYLDLSRITLPLTPVGTPLSPVPLTDRNQPFGVYDSRIRTGYVQNWNLSVTRELPAGVSVDVRYAGSKGTKMVRQIDINEANIFESGILEAFLMTQSGGNAPLLDQIFRGLNLGLGVVNGTTITGSQSVRNNANTRLFFANNNVGEFAQYLNNTNQLSGTNIRGELIRRAGLPENLIVGNPQFLNARIAKNLANSTYHAMQVELNKPLSSGWTLQSSYTWSRTIGEVTGNANTLIEIYYKDGRNRHLDKRIIPFHRTHAFKANGTYELPFGPNKAFLNAGSGLLSRLTERWQFGGILNLVSGTPLTLTSGTSTFNQYINNNTANLVGPLAKDFGTVTRDDVGVRYFQGLTVVRDPAASALTGQQGLNQLSTLQALTDSSGRLIAVNPAPGTIGKLAPGYLEGPGRMSFDLNLIKRIRIGEGTEFEFRADAIDILNRPIFGNPETDINIPNFGRITETLGGNRILVLNARFNF